MLSKFLCFIQIIFLNVFINIIHIIWVFNKGFKSVLSHLLITKWYFSSYGFLAYKEILSISGWSLRINNKFVFPDREALVISILYGWSAICHHIELCSVIFWFINSSKIIVLWTLLIHCYIKFFPFYILNFWLFHTHMFVWNLFI